MSHDRINSYQPFSTPDRHIASQFLEFLESLKEEFCRIHKKNRTIAAQITETMSKNENDCMNTLVRYPDNDLDHPPPDPNQFVSDTVTIRYTETKQSETILEIERAIK